MSLEVLVDLKPVASQHGTTRQLIRNEPWWLTPLDLLETKAATPAVDPEGPMPDARKTWAEFLAWACPKIKRMQSADVKWRHAGWSNRRGKVLLALAQAGATWGRIERFAKCGRCSTVHREAGGKRLSVRGEFCRDRFCLACGTARSRRLASNVATLVRGRDVRFITLTLRHSDADLRTCLNRLMKGFKALRDKAAWAGTQRGGVAFVEVKRSRNGRAWHPHLHILSEGGYIQASRLGEAWKEVTGDSHVVDVRRMRNEKELVSYVCKYASKPMDATLFKDDLWLEEAICSLKGRRLCTTFGSWRGARLLSKPKEQVDWIHVARVTELLREARRGFARSTAILVMIQRRLPFVGSKRGRRNQQAEAAEPSAG